MTAQYHIRIPHGLPSDIPQPGGNGSPCWIKGWIWRHHHTCFAKECRSDRENKRVNHVRVLHLQQLRQDDPAAFHHHTLDALAKEHVENAFPIQASRLRMIVIDHQVFSAMTLQSADGRRMKHCTWRNHDPRRFPPALGRHL